MIVGAQKSGTSSLLRYLAQHPDIHTHPQPGDDVFPAGTRIHPWL